MPGAILRASFLFQNRSNEPDDIISKKLGFYLPFLKIMSNGS